MSLIRYVTKIHFAENVLEDAIEAELGLLGVTRPLILSDHAAARRGVLDRLLAAMPCGVTPALVEVPAGRACEDDCIRASKAFRDAGADGLIAFGDAAAMGLAKATGVRLGHPGPLRHYTDAEGGGARIRDAIPPLIAVPSVAASCSEGLGAAIVTLADGSSAALASPHLTPRVLICDPTLTLDIPADQTAAAGMDALTHCIETYVARAYNPPADGIALDGLRRVAAHLEQAVGDASDLRARREMMAAALNGALASQKGLGGVHAMSHALGGIGAGALDHGAINGVLLPFVLEFNAPAVAPRYAEIRRELGLPARADLADAIVRLRERVSLPARLGEMGIAAGHLSCAANRAAADYANRTNPRHAGAADYFSILSEAL